ncbi:MAG: ATP-grasp domain-containing protein [Bacteroidaceae bacterium]|nr:ATP-grasp domain-containing protein [Bacteroidaceae bacterium]
MNSKIEINRIIVFGNDHTNNVGVIQSLGLAGIRSIGLLFGGITGFVACSKFTEKVITAKDSQTCIEKLLMEETIEGEKTPIIACCDDAAMALERNKERLKEHYVFGHSFNYSLSYLSIKEHQVRMAQEAGFRVPQTWNLNETKEIPYDVCYPCLIKPLISSEGAKTDIRVCRTREELEKNLNSLTYTKSVLLQQYIERDYEISILGCGLSSGKCLIPAVENKLTLYPQYVGLECLVNMQPLEEGTIKSCIEQLVESIGYVGLFSVEMMHCKEDGKFYFTEINLRNDGAEAFLTKYGANLPLNHVQDLLGYPLTEQKQYHPGYYIWDMHHFLSFVHRDIPFLTWLKEIKMSKGFMMYFKEDRKPFFRQYKNWILQKFHIRKNESYT